MVEFKSQYSQGSTILTMQVSSDSTLPEIIEDFERFLRATGYIFAGHLDIVEDEE